MPTNILLHGSGAIGTIYVYLLLQAGCSVTAVCRSNYEAAKANGFTIDSDKYGQGVHVRPTQVARSLAEAAAQSTEAFDYVIVCTKALPEARTAKLIQPAVTEGKTTIVLIQNGIGIENEYASLFPSIPLLSCVVYLPTTQISPAHIQMGAIELLEIGTYPASAYTPKHAKAATDFFLETVKRGGSDAHFYPEIQEQRWRKLLVNASWNPICALTLSRDVAFLASSPSAESCVEGVMREAVAVAQALGYKSVTADMAAEQMERATGRMGGRGIEPSMLVDVLSGRRMEVEVILGEPVRIARRLGVSVPRMETLYALGKGLDEAVARRRPGMSLGGDEAKAAA